MPINRFCLLDWMPGSSKERTSPTQRRDGYKLGNFEVRIILKRSASRFSSHVVVLTSFNRQAAATIQRRLDPDFAM